MATTQALLRAGADPNQRFGSHSSPLLAQARSPEMLELLLDAGVVVEPRMVVDQDSYDRPHGAERVLVGIANGEALSWTGWVEHPSLETRTAMLRRVIEARSIAPEQVAKALRSEVFRSQPAGVQALLAADADPHSQPRLLAAVCFGAQDPSDDASDPERVVGLLVEAGLDPDDEDERGFRPLLTALSPDTFGPEYQESDGYNGSAALGLIRHGAEVNLVYPATEIEQLEPPKVAGWTPLLVAAHFGDGPVVEALLVAGADPRVTTPQGSTAVDLAQAGLAALAERVPPAPPADDANPWRHREYDSLVQSRRQHLDEAERALALIRAAGAGT